MLCNSEHISFKTPTMFWQWLFLQMTLRGMSVYNCHLVWFVQSGLLWTFLSKMYKSIVIIMVIHVTFCNFRLGWGISWSCSFKGLVNVVDFQSLGSRSSWFIFKTGGKCIKFVQLLKVGMQLFSHILFSSFGGDLGSGRSFSLKSGWKRHTICTVAASISSNLFCLSAGWQQGVVAWAHPTTPCTGWGEEGGWRSREGKKQIRYSKGMWSKWTICHDRFYISLTSFQ